MKHILFLLSILVLISCGQPNTVSKEEQVDVYGKSTEPVQVEEGIKVDSSILAHYLAYSSSNKRDIQDHKDYYHIEMEHLDPQGYCVRNLFNEGQEWYLTGDLKDGFLIMSGNNTGGGKRIGGSIELLNEKSDTLFVSLSVHKTITNSDNTTAEVSERREEIWMKQK